MKRTKLWVAWGAYSLSATAHGWFLCWPPRFAPTPPVKAAASFVQFTVIEPNAPKYPELNPKKIETETAPAPTQPKVKPRPDPEPLSDPELETEPSAELNQEPPIDAAQAQSANPAPELSGTTLLGTAEASWSAEAGSGRERHGSLVSGLSRGGARSSQKAHLPKAQPPKALSQLPPVIALKNLRQRPSPPNLSDALKRNYPSQARAQGKGGEAKIRARVDADGQIRETQMLHESESGFGRACEATLKHSRWTPPISKEGVPVATWISYRCSFLVDD